MSGVQTVVSATAPTAVMEDLRTELNVLPGYMYSTLTLLNYIFYKLFSKPIPPNENEVRQD